MCMNLQFYYQGDATRILLYLFPCVDVAIRISHRQDHPFVCVHEMGGFRVGAIVPYQLPNYKVLRLIYFYTKKVCKRRM